MSLPMRTRFTFDGAVATPLGPRDDAWLAAAIERPQVAIDVWPWWSDAVDSRSLLGRALCLMWTEIRWRPPGPGEEEAMDEVLELLRRAYVLDPSLDYPWPEWAELMGYRGHENALAETVRDRADGVDRPLFGYRRRPVTIRHEGWSLTVPGSFGERLTSEEWWGGESKRTITLAATATEADGGPMPPDAFLARVAADLGDHTITHQRRASHGSGQDHDRCELGRRSRRRRGLLGRRRQRGRDPHRVRRPIRLGVGHRHVALAQLRVSRRFTTDASPVAPATDRPRQRWARFLASRRRARVSGSAASARRGPPGRRLARLIGRRRR